MFDIGFGEIFLIAVVALLVLGPERLPKAARFAGLWVRRARAQWYSVKAELENELADDELRRSLKQTRADLLEARDSLAQSGAALQQEIEQTGAEVRDAFQSGSAESDNDHEAPLSSVTDGLDLESDDGDQPQLPFDDHAIDPDEVEKARRESAGDAISEDAHPAGSGHDARR